MIKTVLSKMFLVAMMSCTLVACGSGDETRAEEVQKIRKKNLSLTESELDRVRDQGRMDNVIENGVIDLPGKPGYKLRQYINVHRYDTNHFLYVIEKDDVPVAGVGQTHSLGKLGNVLVSTEVTAPTKNENAITVTCKVVTDCMRELEKYKVSTDEDFRKYQELKEKFEPASSTQAPQSNREP